MKRRTTHYSLLLILVITIHLSNNPTRGFNIKRFFSRFRKDKDDTTTQTSNPPPADPADFQTALSLAFGPSTCTPTATQTCPSHPLLNATSSYGVDVSFPMHHPRVSRNYPWLPHNVHPERHATPPEFENVAIQTLGDKTAFYDGFMRGCREMYPPGKVCDRTERERIEMTRSQPRSMQNYTTIGFKKIRAPSNLMDLLYAFYADNAPRQTTEKWPPGNIYTNHWHSPTSFLPIDDPSLVGGGPSSDLSSLLWSASRDSLQKWTGRPLSPTSLYGIRIYREGSVLSPHVDRLPLVTSAIINVDQDVDEEWPLEVIAHDGRAYNVTMRPGDMVLYESHSVIHGRPFPLKGRHYANVFIHFEPTGHTLRHESLQTEDDDDTDDPSSAFEQAFQEMSAVEDDDEEEESLYTSLPPYILPGTPEEKRWRQQHPGGKIAVDPHSSSSSSSDEDNNENTDSNIDIQKTMHHDAAIGDLVNLKRHARHHDADLFKADSNGWTVIHEAARGGRLHILKYLLSFKEGRRKMNDRTNDGFGGSPTWWAERNHGKDSEVVVYMKSMGGESLKPLDLDDDTGEAVMTEVMIDGQVIEGVLIEDEISEKLAEEFMMTFDGKTASEGDKTEVEEEDDFVKIKEWMENLDMENLDMENQNFEFNVEDIKIVNMNEGEADYDKFKEEIEKKMKEAIDRYVKKIDNVDGSVKFVKKLDTANDVYDDYDSSDDDDDDDDDDK